MIMTHMSEADIWTPDSVQAPLQKPPKRQAVRPARSGEHMTLAYVVGFLMILPVIVVGRLSSRRRADRYAERLSLFGETRSAVLTALGFSLMGR